MKKILRWRKVAKNTWQSVSKSRNATYIIVEEKKDVFCLDMFKTSVKDDNKAWVGGEVCESLRAAKSMAEKG